MYEPPSRDKVYDPNFPPNLDIKPSTHPNTFSTSSQSHHVTLVRSSAEAKAYVENGAVSGDRQDEQDRNDLFEQAEGIKKYGIAGKVWDASYPILPYLSPPSSFQNNSSPTAQATTQHEPPLFHFDPPCSIFASTSKLVSQEVGGLSSAVDRAEGELTILELGSGQSLATLHLLDQLLLLPRTDTRTSLDVSGHTLRPERKRPRVYLTDLPNVVPLCERNIARWRDGQQDHAAVDEGGDGVESEKVEVKVMPLAWGDLIMGDEIRQDLMDGLAGTGKESARKMSHILLIDLIYFPHLYPLLMRTLLQVTGSAFCFAPDSGDSEVGGPEVIITYKTRSLEFEEPFFNTLGYYFQLTPLLSRKRVENPEDAAGNDSIEAEIQKPSSGTGIARHEYGSWQIHGVDDETYTYICRRWKSTLVEGWTIPEGNDALMNGGGPGKMVAERGFGWVEGQLGAIEWD